MKVSLFDYELPKGLIANSPVFPRDSSRLMIIDRKTGKIEDKHFYNIVDYLSSNDVLVLNKTKVFPARLFVNKITGGKVELLFLEEVGTGIWKCLTKPGVKIGMELTCEDHTFKSIRKEGQTLIVDTRLPKKKLMDLLQTYGRTPIPPYIKSSEKESDLREEYQTIYADKPGSVAAPTAGFHFTKELLKKLKTKGVQIEYVTLHVGMGTFVPVKSKNIEDHLMHFESYEIDKIVAERLNLAKRNGKRIIAVGTTSARTLESVSDENFKLIVDKLNGSTNIFIYPGYKFRFVDGLITNFHLPKSTLIALVSAFVCYPNIGRKADKKYEFRSFKTCLMGKAYKAAIVEKYRFYSFGDACFIL